MSAAAALHSDHLNFLIYRYLQEFGHEKTARAFHRDWHRPAEHEDPESFPFAHAVQRNDLISVIQDGLHHDELLARVRKCDRRFRWTAIEARESVERQDGVIENGMGSRPPSHIKQRKPRVPSHVRPGEDFITPAPKRQRRSDGSEAQVNGDRDAMDVDAASASADAEEDNEIASPTAASEAEGIETVIRYDSMEVGTQTDRIKTTTIHWKVERPGAFVSQCIWNPSVDPKDARCLLAVGDSLCRFYQLPSVFGNEAEEITHADESSLPPDSAVTTTDWRPDGTAASCAIDGVQKLPDGSNFPSQSLVEYNRVAGSIHFQPGPSLLDPPGSALQLRYSSNGEYLLLARMNLERGLVQIWATSKAMLDNSSSPREPIAWCTLDQLVYDACWIAEDTFLVCGADGLSAIYRVLKDDGRMDVEMNGVETKEQHGLQVERHSLIVGEDELDKLRYDPRHKIAVFSSTKARRLIATSNLTNSDEHQEQNLVVELDEQLTDLSFQPWHRSQATSSNSEEHSQPTYLATAFEDGSCIIYGFTREVDVGPRCSEVASLSLIDGPALALAWSANGQYLAVGNTDVVQIWQADSLRRKNGIRHTAEAVVTWRRPPEPKSLPNGAYENGQETAATSEPSLSWSSDGESLAFAIDQQIAVIRFRPPLNGRANTNIEVNGRPTP